MSTLSNIFEFFRQPTIDHSAHGQFVAATAMTTASVTTTGVFWGLHMADIYMAISCLATVCSVVIQILVARHNMKKS